MHPQVHYTIDDNHIAIISFDLPNKSMNVLTEQGINEFESHVFTAIHDKNIIGIIITSGKKDFLGGVDLSLLGHLCDPYSRTPSDIRAEKCSALLMRVHTLLRKLETSGKPVACAITGTCMGGGFEIALSCHYRVASNKDNAQLGLPESKVGLFPGFGGTQRLPRLIGVTASSEALLQGKSYNPKQWKKMGVLHAVVPERKLLDTAKNWILSEAPNKAVQPWDKAGFEITIPDINAFRDNTKNFYKAQDKILLCLTDGLSVPFDQAIPIEVNYFADLITDGQAFNMIRSLFLNKQALDKGTRRPKIIPITPFKKIAVIGTGIMGSSVAYAAAKAGIKVLLIDTSLEKVEQGKEYAIKICNDLITKKKINQKTRDKILNKIMPKTQLDLLKGVNIVIDCINEDISVKIEMLKKIQEIVGNKCIIASNTSTISVNDLAKNMIFKRNFIGLNMFASVDKTTVIEIIKGKRTGERALAKVLDFLKILKKTPIIVQDTPLFYVYRCMVAYIHEATRMITQGISMELIENASIMLGFPMGVLQQSDDIFDILKDSDRLLHQTETDNAVTDLMKLMLKLGRNGKNAGMGFYDYNGREKTLFTGITEHYPLADIQPNIETVQKRLINIQLIEAIKALEEGVITDIRDADVGAIFGWGFCPWSGGPLSMIDTIGTGDFMRECEKMTKQFGIQFKPPKLLREMGKGGERFYVRFNPELPTATLKDVQKLA